MLEMLILAVYVVVLYTSAFLFMILVESETVTESVEQPEEWPSLTVAVPAFNEEETISKTLESILDSDYPYDRLEVLVVNDGSTDNTREVVEEYEDRSQVTLINQENQGKGGALNTALENASGELFACVDADSMLLEKSLKNIVARMDEDTAGVASAMKVYEPDNMLERIQMVEYVMNVFARKLMERISSIHVTPGALAIYRSRKIQEVGGFDENSRVEDQEICWRLQEEHEKIKHSREGETYTVVPDNLRDYYRQRRRWYTGTFETVIQYRSMILNREYGDFGMFTAPSKIVNPAVSIFGLLLVINAVMSPVVGFFSDIMSIGSDALSFGLELSIPALIEIAKWQLLGLDFTFLTFIGAMSVFSISFVYMASIHVEEDITDLGLLPSMLYIFWFFIVVGFMSLVSLIVVARKQLLGRDIGW